MDSNSCWICDASCTDLGDAELLGHPVHFSLCSECGSVRTEEPFWLDEAYSRPTPDLGLVDRNLQQARAIRLIYSTLGGKGKLLDFGGGTGLLVRLLRDRGVDAWWCDPMAANQMARGFNAALSDARWTAITAIEVLEHVPRTASIVKNLMSLTDCLIISTLPIPEPAPPFDQWWYYLLDEGQHVSFPTIRGLKRLAASNGAQLISSGSMHLIVRTSPLRMTMLEGVVRAMRVSAKVHSLRRSLLTKDATSLAGLMVDKRGGGTN